MTSSVHFSTMSTNQNDKEFMAKQEHMMVREMYERCNATGAWKKQLEKRKREIAVMNIATDKARLHEIAEARRSIMTREVDDEYPRFVYRFDQNGNFLFDDKNTLTRTIIKGDVTRQIQYHALRDGDMKEKLLMMKALFDANKKVIDISSRPPKKQ